MSPDNILPDKLVYDFRFVFELQIDLNEKTESVF